MQTLQVLEMNTLNKVSNIVGSVFHLSCRFLMGILTICKLDNKPLRVYI